MSYNLNSGYGNLQATALSALTTGKTFLVAKPTQPDYASLAQLFVPDTEGTSRIFPTITTALAQCTASRGDVIYVAPGYTETVTSAAWLTVTVAGVSIIGLGTGTLRPTVTFSTSTAASFDITAANVYIKNMIFTNAIDAQLAMVNVTATDVTFLECDFNTNSATTGTVAGILTAATATRLKVDNCRFIWPAVNSGTTTTAQIKHESGVDYIISNNYFTGKMTQAIVNVATVLRGTIFSNRFVVATGTSAITMAAASTPFISNNRINVPSGTTPITAAAGFVAGNTYSAAAGVTAGTASTF
jgi:uncharacterized protein YwbE